DLFLEAIAKGSRRRSTEAHSLLGGVIEVITYDDPLDGSRRHAVWEAVDAGSNWEVVDHPHYEAAEAHYLDLVHEHLDDDLPYLSSDVETVKVGRNSTAPPGTTAFGDGTL
ncbi:hypothetical protein K7G98_37825, partial [Saccharothrix sp. MB29]|nr:hypothetical protein [Saccharothrix sp. MB29]